MENESVYTLAAEGTLQPATPEESELLTRWYRFAAAIGVPDRLHAATVKSRTMTPALTAIRTLTADLEAGACIVLAGPTGVGKSYAAVAGLRACTTTHTSRADRWFTYFPALCGRLLDPATRQDILAKATMTPLVVFDDLGVEYVKEGGLIDAFLDEIVWTREAYDRATIFTTNLTPEQLAQRLSDRIVDRLKGPWGQIIACPGSSLREPR